MDTSGTLKRSWSTILSCLVVGCITFSVSWVWLYRIVPPPGTILMLSRLLSTGEGISYDYVGFDRISDDIKVCAIAAEDQHFPFHSGLDLGAIEKAIAHNKKGRKTRGASTITQQVAKNAFLFEDRSYLRKGLELYFTFWVETLWTKRDILEMYLNIAEMGNNIFGVASASEAYFRKPAGNLSLKESASIIAVLPSPRKYKVKNPGPYIAGRQKTIARMYAYLEGRKYLRELYVRGAEPVFDVVYKK